MRCRRIPMQYFPWYHSSLSTRQGGDENILQISIKQLSTKQFFIFLPFCFISPSNKTFLGRFVFLQESKLEFVKIPQAQETNRKGSFVAPCTDNLPIFYFRKAINCKKSPTLPYYIQIINNFKICKFPMKWTCNFWSDKLKEISQFYIEYPFSKEISLKRFKSL